MNSPLGDFGEKKEKEKKEENGKKKKKRSRVIQVYEPQEREKLRSECDEMKAFPYWGGCSKPGTLVKVTDCN